jgi:hypothetical protein
LGEVLATYYVFHVQLIADFLTIEKMGLRMLAVKGLRGGNPVHQRSWAGYQMALTPLLVTSPPLVPDF